MCVQKICGLNIHNVLQEDRIRYEDDSKCAVEKQAEDYVN